MRRALWFLSFAMLLVPQAVLAIQLRWAGGATDLTVSSNTQAVLVVQADSAEISLPNTWRLQWTADSLGVQFSAFDPNQACLVDTAEVDSIAPPSTPADSAANQITAWFCSSGSSNATAAYYLVGLPAGGHGKMKVMALNPADTTQVLESNEVTLNGGIDGDYAPLILSASRIHQGDQYLASAIGTGLGGVTSIAVGSPTGAWSAPLQIVERSSTNLLATGDIAAPLPSAVLQVTGVGGSSMSPPMAPDEVLEPQVIPAYTYYVDASHHARPKDFAFFYDGLGHFHLVYIRHSTALNDCSQGDLNETKFTHVSGDLFNWSAQDTSFTVGGGGWDSKHIWAPTIVQNGNLYYMFYAGVNATNDQSIGYVTTANINANPVVWSTARTQVFTVASTHNHWALQASPQQCRDPFITKDPSDTTRWLMYYTANVGVEPTWETVGVARSAQNSLTSWTDIGPLYIITDLQNYSLKAESPHVFPHLNINGTTSWWTLFTSDFNIMADRNASGPADTTETQSSTHWDLINQRLYQHLTNYDPRVQYWNGSEYLKVGSQEYLAGYNAAVVDPCGTVVNPDSNGVWIVEMQWTSGGLSPDAFALRTGVTAVEPPRPEEIHRVSLGLVSFVPGAGRAAFAVELPVGVRGELAVFDVLGRRVRVLSRGGLTAGRTVVKWDGSNDAGGVAGSGVYFARLMSTEGVRIVRLPLFR